MMMVQTSIQTALHENPGVEPSELLTIINRTISKNIRMLEEDKYMTITVLASHEDGRFVFAGLHQDIMVYRAGRADVELIETQGTWIGLMDDISGMMPDDTLKVNHGDTILLFTDGITEAWHKGSVENNRDVEVSMFGSKRLIDIFKKLGSRTPEEIISGIISELDNYDCTDDVTLVVIKMKPE
jgi:sigma-B regulation protein RsbU (phosphoserine phosphatase)